MPKKPKPVPAGLRDLRDLRMGIGVSAGIVMAPALVIHDVHETREERVIESHEVEPELKRLETALAETRTQIEQLRAKLDRQSVSDEGLILDAHLLLLDDPSFLQNIRQRLRKRLRNVEIIVREVANDYVDMLKRSGNAYLSERAIDLHDVSRRLVRNLAGDADVWTTQGLDSEYILVVPELTPSDTVALPRDRIVGMLMDRGSATAHSALLARALQLPTIVGLHSLTSRVRTGDPLLMDGNTGRVILFPAEADREQYRQLNAARQDIRLQLDALRDQPSVTPDGHPIQLLANIEGVTELDAVQQYGAEGIGLFRTEYLWLTGRRDVNEHDQVGVYGEVARRMDGRPVIIRVLDLGGDKFPHAAASHREPNPFLGVRAIRYLLRNPAVFKTQLRAILRASLLGDVHLLYPMISDVHEICEANAMLETCKQELIREDLAFNPDLRIGAMIEIPSAALTADALARHVDFFCIGTNDLIQYTLAADRGNENVSDLYMPTHPSVVRLIHETVEAGHVAGIWVGVCGEMASDPLLAPLLIGMGVDELSVAPAAVPLIKDVIRKIPSTVACDLCAEALRERSAGRIRELSRDILGRYAPELLELIE